MCKASSVLASPPPQQSGGGALWKKEKFAKLSHFASPPARLCRSWTESRRKSGKVVCEREIWVKLTNQPPDAVCSRVELEKKEITRVQDSRSVKAEIGNRRILVVSEISLVWIDWKVQLADRQTYCNDTEDLSMLYIKLRIFVIAQEVIKYIALLWFSYTKLFSSTKKIVLDLPNIQSSINT